MKETEAAQGTQCFDVRQVTLARKIRVESRMTGDGHGKGIMTLAGMRILRMTDDG